MVSSFVTKRVLALLLAATINTHQRQAETNLQRASEQATEPEIVVAALGEISPDDLGDINRPIKDPIVRPLAAVVTTVTFQQGTAGYAGAVDTYIDAAATATNNGAATSLSVDVSPSVKQALLRFGSMFTSQGGPIPDGATITSATLRLNGTNVTAQQVGLHRMLRTWAATNTWTTFGASPWNTTQGIQLDGVEAVAAADVSTTLANTGPFTINVTSSVQAWSSGAAAVRNGWVFNETADDSLVFDSSEAATVANRPLLTVIYTACTAAADCNDNNPCTDDSCTSGACRNIADNTNTCSDSVACTTEQCSAGVCVKTCNCPTGQACNYSTGQCLAAAPLPVAIGDSWKYFKGTTNPPGGWNSVCFDDSTWLTGAGGFGFGADCNGTQQRNTTLTDMQGPPNSPGYQSVYMRRVFDIPNAAAISGLNLNVDYDDGFVAYLNGTEIARSASMGGTVGTQPAFNATPAQHECSVCDGTCNPTQSFLVSAALLVSGANVLAIQAHNSALADNDFTIAATLQLTAPPNLPPAQPTSPSPANNATGVAANPMLCVNVSDPDPGNTLTVTFKGRQATGVAGNDFTVIALPDTQFYAQSFPATFNAQTQWIRDNTPIRNIVFVTQLGDCTNDGDSIPLQWTRADAAFDILELPMTGFPQGMPYGIAVGNHDQTPSGTPRTANSEVGTTTSYNATFGRQRFCPGGVCRSYFGDNYTFGGAFPDAMDNHYELFSASGMDFISFHLEWDPTDNATRQAVLAWVHNLLATQYSNRRAMLSAHYFLNGDGTFSNQGQATFDAIKDLPNVFMMLSGHQDQAGYRAALANDGHTIHAMMSDYQTRPNGGNGWLRILTFSPQNDTVHVETWSPTVEGGRFINKPTRHADDLPTTGGNELMLSYDMQSGPSFTTIGTTTGVTSGTQTCVQWNGAVGQVHEWQVTVSDGSATTNGPTWTFTSAPCTSNAQCNDNNACNGVETCSSGACVAGSPPSCDDNNQCTDDSCVPATGCAHVADNTNTCSDNNPNTLDACSNGTCVGTPIVTCTTNNDCNDSNACTLDSCDVANRSALSFDGVNDYVTMGAASGLNLSPRFTIETWMKGVTGAGIDTGAGGIDGAIPLVTKGKAQTETPATVNMNYFLGVKGGALVADFEDGVNGTNHPICSTAAIPNPTAWHHVAATYDGTCWQLYVDGQAQTINQSCWNCTSNCPTQTTCPGVAPEPNSQQRFGLGAGLRTESNPEQPGGFYGGQLDEVRVWNVARTQAQIQASMNQQLTTGTGLVGRWGLNEQSGGTTLDSNPDGGASYDGTLTPASPNGPVWVTGAANLPNLGQGTCRNTPLEQCCTTNAQCADTNPCTIDSCVSNSCVHQPGNQGVSCSDGNACTENDACNAGTCTGSQIPNCCNTVADCNDNNVCTDDSCTPSGCVHTNNDAECTDGNACTGPESCSNGACITEYDPTPGCCIAHVDCNDGNPVTADTCSFGTCLNVATCATVADCSDGNACTDDRCTQAALSFDGVNDYVTMGAASGLNASPGFTVETWFWWTGGGSAVGTGGGGITAIPLVSKGRSQLESPANLNMNYFLGITGGRLASDFEDATGVNHPACASTSTPAITTNAWHHAAATYDGLCWQLYLDGVPLSTDTSCSTCDEGTCTICPGVSPEANSIQRFALGSALRSESSPELPAGFFAGRLDEVRVWNVARSASEVLAGMDKPIVSGNGLLGRWALDDGAGPTVTDSDPNFDGSAYNGTKMPVSPDGPEWITDTAGLSGHELGQCAYSGTPHCCETAGDCEDNNLCTVESCVNNACVNAWTPGCCLNNGDCSDADVCTTDTCNVSLNQCVYANNTANCNDQSACTSSDVCSNGTCAGATIVSLCDDSVPCTTDVCADAAQSALIFDGVDDYVSMGAAPGLNVSPNFTIETWFQWDGNGVATDTGAGGITAIPLVTKGRAQTETPANVNMNYFLGISGSRLAADFEDAATGLNHPACAAASTPAITTGVWHHAAATFDGTCWQIYLDGSPLAIDTACSVCAGGACTVCPGPGVAPEPNSVQRFALGSALRSESNPEQPAGFFSGRLDEVRIWNYARSAADILSNKDRRLATGIGLFGRFGLDEGTSAAAGDSTGHANAGVLTAMPAIPWVAGAPTLAAVQCANTPDAGCCTVDANCNDGNVCTDDACVSNHCQNVNNSAPCSDGTACTANDTCSNGICAGVSIAAQCDDLVPCTTDSCSDAPAQNALVFDGTNDYVTMGAAPGLNVSPAFTLETWFMWDGNGVATDTGGGGIAAAIPLMSKGRAQAETPANVNTNYFFGLAGGRLVADFEDAATGLNHPICTSTSQPTISTNVWHHAAATYDGTCWQLYLDGSPLAIDTSCSSCAGAACNICPGASPEPNSIQRFALGSALRSESSPEQPAGFFSGRLDEARVWNYARSSTQVLAFRDRKIPSALGLIGRWGLDEGTSTSAGDSTGNGNTGTLTSMPSNPWVAGQSSLGAMQCTSTPAAGCCTATVQCNDANVCTNDSCNVAANQCGYVNNTNPCTDSNACTSGDICSNGVCAATPIPNCCNTVADCDDTNDCSLDACVGNGAAVNLAGTANDFVNLGNDGNTPNVNYMTNFGTGSFTIEGWFYANAATASLTGIFRTGRQGAFSQVAVQTQGPTPFNKLGGSVENTTGNQIDSSAGITFTLNAWHHFALVVDRTAGNQKLIVILDGDGATMTTTNANALSTNPITDTLNGANREPAVLGSARDASGVLVNNFDGRVDDVRIWDRALTLAEVQDAMARQVVSATGLRHRWAFNEGSGTAADTGGTPTTTAAILTGPAAWLTSPSQIPVQRSECGHSVTNEGLVCNDRNGCTTGEFCTIGTCGGGSATNCDDLNVCTDDTCQAPGGCVHSANSATCDDLNPCTTNDFCSGGACGGPPTNCDDGDACTVDSCNPVDGCTHTALTCNDGNFCTDDTCNSSSGCVFAPHSCDDGVACTTDSCNENADRCDHAVSNAACSDGLFCTDDVCHPTAGCQNPAHSCADSVACTVDSCNENTDTCDHAPNAGACSDGLFCTDDVCHPTAGCQHPTHSCDDAIACTGDSCNEGADRCDHTPNNTVCADTNPCTDDICNPASGCVNPNDNTNPCTDGNPCTADSCVNGTCVSGPGCDDGNPCTDDSCQGSTCVHTPDDTNTCSDNNACTAPDVCRSGACVCGQTVSVCTGTTASFSGVGPVTIPTGPAVVTSTVTVSGAGAYLQHLRVTTALAHTANGDLDVTLTSPAGTIVTLTSDNGGTLANVFNGTVWDDDANPSGQVPYSTNSALATDHPYANNTLAANLVPEEAFAAFDGENPNGVWTLRVSDDTASNGGTLTSWSLAVTTLTAAPTKTTASVTQPTDVNIQDLGTVSSNLAVSGRTGQIGKVRVTTLITHNGCGDIDMTLRSPGGTVVTLTTDNILGLNNLFNGTVWDDDADPDGQVPFTSNTNSASDHPYVDNTPVLALTPEEALGAFKDEDPNGTWTLTISDDESGDVGVLSEWRLEITTVECPTPTCTVSCNDNNPCTDDSCNPTTGCVNTPNNANTCSDGNSCTVDTCVNGACNSAGPNCDDGNPCTDDSCTGGTCAHTNDNTNTCSDGSGCTVDACVSGACISTLNCDDGNACTDDLCVSGACAHPNDNTNTCTDNNGCTVDSCVNGQCISAGPNCDDGNPCTDDSCVSNNCVHTNDDTNTCSDGNACTAPDVCRAGACVCGAVSVCTGTTTNFTRTGTTAIPTGPASISSTVTVSGAGPYLQHLRLTTTTLTHTACGDLDITLTSPAGTVVTLTSDNGGTLDNVFNGTVWDDDNNPSGQVPYSTNSGLATDHPYANSVVAANLVPEEAFAAFDGENPNGVWTLRVSDDTAANGGSLGNWSLAVTTLPSAPTKTTASVTNPTDVTIPTSIATVSSNIAVSGRTGRIGKVRVTTLLTHNGSGDIDMTLRSPGGTVVTLTTDNILGLNNLFNGTVWDDDADPDGQVPFTSNTNSASDHAYVDNTPVLALTPEEALGAFKDEDPNGTWTLTISDDQTGDGGLLSEWRLEITTVQCPAANCNICPP